MLNEFGVGKLGTSLGKVSVVTEEISGLNKSGGIGACALGLALHLYALGHEVDILVTDTTVLPEDKFRFHQAYPNLTIRLLTEEVASDEEVTDPVDPISKAYCVYRYVKRLDPRVVHVNRRRNGTPYRLPKGTPPYGCMGSARVGPELS
ncbi:glycogen/starch synthase, partial [Rhizobium sp. CNPSo 4062]|uniref:glycogen/starch synthase n=1 Tax=Rhizobium sp. CNPSo 4062 TaxID=3021410 RepID=UPI00254C22E1